MTHKRTIFILFYLLLALVACTNRNSTVSTSPPALAEELIFYDWSDDSIQTVFDDFTEEYGVKITYLTYDSTEEAVENIRAGQVYDVVVMENQHIHSLTSKDLLAEINYQNVPNFKNISANFRNLAHDPNNHFTIPYSWGATGLVVRTDLTNKPISRWSDMWDPNYTGKVVNWESLPRYTLGAALKSLGYSANTEDPAELEEALALLIAHKTNTIWLKDEHSPASLLINGEAVFSLGWSEDLWLVQEGTDNVDFIFPEEGAILWGDNFVIPANSPNKYTAEIFLNFLLRPEVTGKIINHNYYPMPNDAAQAHINPEILSDPVIYPTNEEIQHAELLLPLSPEGEQLYADVWARFLASDN